ncbi:hypothetical protein [Pseudoruegeria sp. SHC-113]|nr:hypothetical protein [Pseudoruegeria sp. SHC-113]
MKAIILALAIMAGFGLQEWGCVESKPGQAAVVPGVATQPA